MSLLSKVPYSRNPHPVHPVVRSWYPLEVITENLVILLVASYSVNWIHSSTCHAFDLFDALLRQAQLLVPQLEICALAGCVSRGSLTSGIRKSTRTVLLSRGSTDTAQTLACPCTVPGNRRQRGYCNGLLEQDTNCGGPYISPFG